MIRLSKPTVDGAYEREVCAASKCGQQSTVIDATQKRWPLDVPLCDRHWVELCEQTDGGR